jgi:hypothetical protein
MLRADHPAVPPWIVERCVWILVIPAMTGNRCVLEGVLCQWHCTPSTNNER